jgi:hypothetical protein
MHLRVLGQSKMDKKLKQVKIIFSGRPCYIKKLEKPNDFELKALCQQSGRAFYLTEVFYEKNECAERYQELLNYLPKDSNGFA